MEKRKRIFRFLLPIPFISLFLLILNQLALCVLFGVLYEPYECENTYLPLPVAVDVSDGYTVNNIFLFNNIIFNLIYWIIGYSIYLYLNRITKYRTLWMFIFALLLGISPFFTVYFREGWYLLETFVMEFYQ